MLDTLARLEETGISLLLRESGLAFFSSLTLHSLAMAFVVGINIAIALRLLGLMPKIALYRLGAFLPIHWWAVAIIFVSGIALLVAYPAKALTNPVFYIKLAALSTGLALTWRLQSHLEKHSSPNSSLLFGTAMLACWTTTICAGRFLAYTNSILLASSFY